MSVNPTTFFNKYIEKKYDITYDEIDKLLLGKYFSYQHPKFKPPESIILTENAYNKYFDEYFLINPNQKKRFDTAILETKKNLEIAKEEKETFKKYFIDKYNLKNDILLNKLLINIISMNIKFSDKIPKFKNFNVFLQDPEIQSIINPIIEETKIKQQKEEGKKSKLITSIKGPSEKNKELYKIAQDIIANKEEELNVKINQANDKLKELSGLNNDEIESVINDVMIIIKDKINNKTEELKLKEKIIEFLNPAKTGDLISLID